MEEIINLSHDSIINYFSVLQQSGYKSYNDVYKILALTYIEEMLDTFSDFITELDLKDIMTAINCISGTCLISFPISLLDSSLIHKSKVNYLTRITESDTFRMADDKVRLVE